MTFRSITGFATVVVLSALFLTQCAKRGEGPGAPNPPPLDPQTQNVNAVMRAKAVLPLEVPAGAWKTWDASSTVPVTVANPAAVSFVLDKTQFVAPSPIVSELLNFGNLRITTLRDNQLRVCGATQNQKCTKAYLRIYTTGVAGAGLWNVVDGYGAPMTAILGSTTSTVGLEVANAAIMQQITIPANKRVVRLADFTPTPNYNINFDFSDAGAGNYSTTIVVEYALGL